MLKNQTKILFTLLLSLGIIKIASGQINKQPQRITAEGFRKDFIFFRTILSENYPSLYRYADKLTLDKQFDSCYASINPETTELEFFKIIKFLFSAIKDGHLYCGPSSLLRRYMDEEAKLFPLKIYFIKNMAYALSSPDIDLPIGAEIVSINRKPVSQIRKELFQYMVSDGNIETKKYHILNYAFRYYYLMIFGEQSNFEICYKSKGRAQKTIEIKAVTGKEMPQDIESNDPKDFLKLSFKNDMAILTIKTFDSLKLKDSKHEYPAFLKSSFDEINKRKIKKLIIDLRGNGGGRDLYGSMLYTYLADKKFRYYDRLTTPTKNLAYEQFRSDNSSYNDLNASMLDSAGDHCFRLKNIAHSNLQMLQPGKIHFDGKVWFLIDGLSFSTSAEFCAVARSNGRGKFIGEETGGGYYGTTCVQIDTTLPNTKTMISFGTIKYEMAVNKTKYRDRGIIPDYVVTPTINNIINKEDAQLHFALKL